MVLLLLAALLNSCTVTTEYQRRGTEEPLPATFTVADLEQFTPLGEARRLDIEGRSIEQYKTQSGDTTFGLGIIEIDDRGTIDSAQIAQVIAYVTNTLTAADAKRGSILVTFVHGWHHNCATCDSNLACFRRVLAQLQERENTPEGNGRQVIGVYIGWRGRAFTGAADYASIWNRKWRAEDIARRAGTGILYQLHHLWLQHDCTMVTVGHSLGGAFLLSAIKGSLTGSVGDAVDGRDAAYRAVVRTQTARANAAPGARALRSRFGDLVVLLNPAIEAHEYTVFDNDLASAVRTEAITPYDQAQLPVLLVLASSADKPDRFLFPSSRVVAGFDLLHHADIWSKTEQVLAVGHYARQITHYLRYETDAAEKHERHEAQVQEQALAGKRRCDCDVEWESAPLPLLSPAQPEPSTTAVRLAGKMPWQFTAPGFRLTLAADRACSNGPGCRGWDPHSPYIVIQTDASVIGNHDDIFNPRVVSFLADFLDSFSRDKEHLGHNLKKGF